MLFFDKRLLYKVIDEELCTKINILIEQNELPSPGVLDEKPTETQIYEYLGKLSEGKKEKIAKAVKNTIVSAQGYLNQLPRNKLKPVIHESMIGKKSADKYIEPTTFLLRESNYWDSRFEEIQDTPKKALK